MRDTLLFGVLCVVGVVLAYTFVPATLADGEAPEEEATIEDFDESEIRALTFAEQNDARVNTSVPAVERDASVDRVAQSWAEHMAETGLYSHGDFQDRIESNTDCETSGEVIFRTDVLQPVSMGASDDGTYINSDKDAAKALVAGWMNSSQHRLIMIDDDFTHVGVGVTLTEERELYAVVDYCAY